MRDLYGITNPQLLTLNSQLSTDSEFKPDVWNNLAKWLHGKKEYKPEMLAEPEPLEAIKETYRVLNTPLSNLSIKQEIPPELTAALEQNTFIFSGFKTHHELVEASRLLKDKDGNFKPFQRYLNDIEKIDKTYNKTYLRAEYNYATASTQMAVKWKEWEQDGDDYDLQYRTAGDDRVREEHRALNGTTLPPSDPFWNSYLPPNGWNCRCTTVQVRKGKYKQSNSEEAIALGNACTAKPKQQIFRFNPGKEMKVFPPKHPYLPKGCGNCEFRQLSYDQNNAQCRACKAIEKCLERAQFLTKTTLKTYKNGGTVETYNNIDRKTDDFKRIEAAALHFAKQGGKVIITPKFDSPQNCPDYDKIYGSLKGTKYYGKCPDFSVNGVWYEHEGFTTNNSKNAFNKMCNRGLKQSDRIVIEDSNLSKAYMQRVIEGRLKDGQLISEIWVHSNGKLTLLYKKTDG